MRIAYARGDDAADLARRRSEALRQLIGHAWKQAKGRYTLIVEIEGTQP